MTLDELLATDALIPSMPEAVALVLIVLQRDEPDMRRVNSLLASEGGLESTFWAGPEQISRRMSRGEVAIQGGPRKTVKRLQLGFAGEDFGYSIGLGLPDSSGHFMLPGHSTPIPSRFTLDPRIKRESIWSGPVYRPASVLVDRQGPMVREKWERFSALPAVKSGRVHTVSGDLLHRYGPRVVDGLEELARLMHPERA